MRENFFTHTACINIVGIAVYEEGLDFFHSLKCDEELLNVAVMAELHRVDTMLILNLHSMWGEMMYQYFARHGIEFYLIEDDDAFYYKRNYMYEHISELYDCYVDFVDEYSRKSYLGVIREGMSGQLGEYIIAPEPQYMLDGFAPRMGDVAIDAGAFDGETARDFLWCGAKVYSYEFAFRHYPLTPSILLPYQKEIFAHYGLSESLPTWCECVLYAR